MSGSAHIHEDDQKDIRVVLLRSEVCEFRRRCSFAPRELQTFCLFHPVDLNEHQSQWVHVVTRVFYEFCRELNEMIVMSASNRGDLPFGARDRSFLGPDAGTGKSFGVGSLQNTALSIPRRSLTLPWVGMKKQSDFVTPSNKR